MSFPSDPDSQSADPSAKNTENAPPEIPRPQHAVSSLSIILVILICVTAWVIKDPIYAAFRHYRAVYLVEEARSLLEKGQPHDAVAKASAAHSLSPDSAEPIRFLAEASDPESPLNAFVYGLSLINREQATPDDYRRTIRSSIVLRALKTGGSLLDELLIKEPQLAQNHLLGARLALARGDARSCLDFLSLALERAPDDREVQLEVSQFFAGASAPELQASAKTQLLKVADGHNDSIALAAWMRLSQMKGLTPQEVSRISQGINEHSGSGLAHQLEALTCELINEQTPLDEIVTKGIVLGVEDPLLVSRWLGRLREFEQAADLLSTIRPATREVVMEQIYVFDRLAAHPELLNLLDREDVDKMLHPALIFSLKAGVHTKASTGTPAIFWNRALTAASGGSTSGEAAYLQLVAETAERCGVLEVAATAYRRMIRRASIDPSAQADALIRIYSKLKDTGELHSLMEDLHERFPVNASYQFNLAYLKLLSDKDLVGAEDLINHLEEETGKNQFLAIPRSLLALRRSDIPKALSHLKGLTLEEALTFAPADQVIVQAVWQHGNDDLQLWAKQLSAKIDPSGLLPEEAKLLHSAQE